MRSLFIYWKLPPQQAEAGIAAARQWQAELRAAHPGLRTALFRRSDASTGTDGVTLMETLAMDSGIPHALDATLAAAGDAALLGLGAPRRHVEAFDALDD